MHGDLLRFSEFDSSFHCAQSYRLVLSTSDEAKTSSSIRSGLNTTFESNGSFVRTQRRCSDDEQRSEFIDVV